MADINMNSTKTTQLKFHVKGNLRDLIAFSKLVSKRRKKISQASKKKMEKPYINILADKIHPSRQYLIIDKIIEETKTTKTFRFIADKEQSSKNLAYFRAGQYISLKIDIGGAEITRPYSIASSPIDAKNGFYDITIKKIPDGFFTDYIWKNWSEETNVIASGPLGFMYHDNIRDSKTLVGLAGGSGITPFRSMARQICYGNLDLTMTLIYGCSDEDDIIFKQEFDELAKNYPNKFKVVYVLSCDIVKMQGCETGFITSEIIKKYTNPKKDTYYVCGPGIMYDFIEKEWAKLGMPLKQIRYEAYGEIKHPERFETYPQNLIDKEFKITAHLNDKIVNIPCPAKETVLIALERAKLAPPSACRSGECQFCRTKLLNGQIWVSPKSDGRREADKEYGYFHPCASFALSDLEIVLPKTDKRERKF